MKLYYFSKILIIIAFSAYVLNGQDCHYSCKTCVTSSYIRCLSCSDSAKPMTVLQDPNSVEPAYRLSIYPTGACKAQTPQGANGLGIILLIISIAGILITQSYQAFYICSTFQTLALFGLLQVAWIHPSSFILHAFQYFMPINIILSSAKKNDSHLLNYGFYRLDQYMISSQDIGLIAVFVIDCILFAVILGLFILTLHRKKQQKLQEKELQQQTKNQIIPMESNDILPHNSVISQKNLQDKINPNQAGNTMISPEKQNLQRPQPTIYMKVKQFFKIMLSQCLIPRKIMHILIYVFYFMVQQTALSIMVGAVFTISALDVAIWIIYFIQLITIIIITYYQYSVDQTQYNLRKKNEMNSIIQKQISNQQKESQLQKWYEQKADQKKEEKFQFGLSLFISRQCMFIILIKKVVLPLGIVLPINQQYLYFVFYLILFIIQGSFDTKSGRVTCFSRITLWKIFQMIITTLILSYFFNQKGGTTSSGAAAINVFVVISFVVIFISLIVQFVFSFLKLFFGMKKIHNSFQYEVEQQVKNQNQMIKLDNTEQTINNQNEFNNDKYENVFEQMQLTRQITPINNKIQQSKKIQIIEINDQQSNRIQKAKINKDHMLVIEKVQPKVQPKIEPTIIQKDEPKSQKDIQPKEQVKTQINTLSQSNKGKHKQSQTPNQKPILQNYAETIDTNHNEQIQGNHEQVQQFRQNDENKNQQNQQSNRKKKQKKKMRIMDPQLRKRYGLK